MHKLQRMERRQQLRPLLLLATMSDPDPLVPLQQEVQTIPHPQEDMLLLLLGETQIRVRDREDRDRMEVHHPLRGSEKQQRQQRPQQLLLMPMQTPMAMPMVREVLQTLLKVKAKDKRLLRWEISSLMMNWTLSCTVSRFTSGSSFFLSFRPSKTSEGGGGSVRIAELAKETKGFFDEPEARKARPEPGTERAKYKRRELQSYPKRAEAGIEPRCPSMASDLFRSAIGTASGATGRSDRFAFSRDNSKLGQTISFSSLNI